ALTAAVPLLLLGQIWFAAAAVFAGLAGGTFVYFGEPSEIAAPPEAFVAGPDYSLVGAALSLSREPTALTSDEGSLLIVNPAYRDRFEGRPPFELGSDEQARQGLQLAKSMASRDGAGCVAGVATIAGVTPVEVERVGAHGDLLLWRFPDPSPVDPLTSAVRNIQSATGERLAGAGVMAAVVDGKGRLLAA